MKFKSPEGREIKLRKVSDSDYARVRSMTERPLEVCPTCGGREEYIVPGVKVFQSKTYKLDGEEHQCNCQLQMALHVRYLLAGIGYEFMPLDWDKYDGDSDAAVTVNSYIDRWEAMLRKGMGIMLSGKTQGIGKTWGAVHIGKEMIKRGQKVYFIDFPNMVSGLIHEETRIEMEGKMRGTTFLILDDIRIGISELQDNLYAHIFESVIRHRAAFNMPTITTTNLTEAEWEIHFPRLASLLAPKQNWVNVNGQDYRRTADAIGTSHILNEEVEPIV